MSDFREQETFRQEDRGIALLRAFGIDCRRNNMTAIKDLDYVVRVGGQDKYVDFQYSQNYSKYGDIRFDLISAYELGAQDRKLLQKQIAEDYRSFEDIGLDAFKKHVPVLKNGKIMDERLFCLLYFVFNSKCSQDTLPNAIYLVRRDDLFRYVKSCIGDLVKEKRLRLNDKSDLGDQYGSAFLAINGERLRNDRIGIWVDFPAIELNHMFASRSIRTEGFSTERG